MLAGRYHPNLYYRWSKDFLEARKKRIMGDTPREANSSEVSEPRRENEHLKVLVAEPRRWRGNLALTI